MDERALLDLVARPGILAVLRILSDAKKPVSIRGLGVHARVSASGTYAIVQKLAAGGFVKKTKTRRDVLVVKAGPLPKWIGRWELDPPKSWVATDSGISPITVYRRGARGDAPGPVVEMRVLPKYPTGEDAWLAYYVLDPVKALAIFKPGEMNLARLRRRVHQEQLERHATRSGLAEKIGLGRRRGPQARPRKDARRREATKDDE